MLAGRLADLQSHGVVVKRTLPPPTPVTVYELTEAGEALAPVLRELRAWGERFAPSPKAGDTARPAWIIQGAASHGPSLRAGEVCQLQVGGEVFELIGADDEVAVKARPAAAPDAVLTIAPGILVRLASGRIGPDRARGQIAVEGDGRIADHVIRMLAGSAR